MKVKTLGGGGVEAEIARLIETLVETEQRLEELTGGEVDSVASRDGRTFLLRRAQQEVRQRDAEKQAATLAELRALFDVIPAMIWFKDDKNNILRVNQKVADAAEMTVDQIEGKPSHEIYPEDAERFYADDLEVLNSGVAKLGYVERIQAIPDGPVAWVQTDKVPCRDQNGNVVGIVVVVKDITESKNRESSQLFKDQQFRSLVEATSAILWSTPASGEFIVDQPQWRAFTGQTTEELLGWGWLNAVHPDDQAETARVWSAAVSSRSTYKVEHRLRTKDHSYREMMVRAVPVLSEDSQIVQWIGVHTDITDLADLTAANEKLIRAVSQADAANLAKSEFLSNMSHELRTPMNSVLGYAQLLYLQNQDPTVKEFAQLIMQGGKHLLEMINEVLEVAQMESGTLSLSLEQVNFGELLDHAFGMVRPLADDAGIDLEADGEALRTIDLQADRQRLLQVLVNLLGNAIKFNRSGGTVTVRRGAAAPGRVRIEIVDTGTGISKEHQTLLFQPFQRFANLGTEGTGLGLALSKRFMTLMQGELGIAESSPAGSTFFLELQTCETASSISTKKRCDVPINEVLLAHRGSVLCIEDNPANMGLIAASLSRYDDIVLIPSLFGIAGVELAGERCPDVILLDIHLPDIMGEEVLKRLKADPLTAEIPVIVLSADATQRQIDKLLLGGAHEYLTKPIDLTQLIGALTRFLPLRDAK